MKTKRSIQLVFPIGLTKGSNDKIHKNPFRRQVK